MFCFFVTLGIILLLIIIIYKKKDEKFISLGNSDIQGTYENLTHTGNGISNGNWISNGNSNSNSNSNSYTPWTISKNTKPIVINIIKQILNKINKKTKMSYYFIDFDQLKQDIISQYYTRFTADFFVHEMKNLITRHIILIFTLNIKTNNVRVEYINLSNAFKNNNKSFKNLVNYPVPELIIQDTTNRLSQNTYQVLYSDDIQFTQFAQFKKIPSL